MIMSDEPEKIRVSKLLSQQGLCSRREADAYIERGWVLVDGEPVTELGTRVFPHQKVTLTKSAQAKQNASVTILMHKPIGVVSGQPEPGYKPALSLVTAEAHFKGDRSPVRFTPMHTKGLAPAGRLDIDSTGLLVLTQDGRIAKQLIGENSPIEKEYLVRIVGTLSAESLAKLNFGLSLDGQALKRAQVNWLNKEQLRFILREGKKRQIRRMCELVDVRVAGLKRVRIGKVMLGDLPLGQWRYLRDDEKF
jgi:23S rRNA pseudouridine2604 synthase